MFFRLAESSHFQGAERSSENPSPLTYLRLLDLIQIKGLRIVINVFRTSLKVRLDSELNILPFVFYMVMPKCALHSFNSKLRCSQSPSMSFLNDPIINLSLLPYPTLGYFKNHFEESSFLYMTMARVTFGVSGNEEDDWMTDLLSHVRQVFMLCWEKCWEMDTRGTMPLTINPTLGDLSSMYCCISNQRWWRLV